MPQDRKSDTTEVQTASIITVMNEIRIGPGVHKVQEGMLSPSRCLCMRRKDCTGNIKRYKLSADN